jgi:hypothetical protein
MIPLPINLWEGWLRDFPNSPLWLQEVRDLSNFPKRRKKIGDRGAEDSFDLGFDPWKTLLGGKTAGGNSWQILPNPLWKTCGQNR